MSRVTSEERKKYSREYYLKNQVRLREYRRQWCLTERGQQTRKEYRDKIRLTVLSHYSQGKLVCNCCGESNYGFLTLDHINSDGWKEKKKEYRRHAGWKSYKTLIDKGFPEGYQVLCYNCNCGRDKTPSKICPHKVVIGNV